jgi:nucleotide-binding universal stress UspA family protein
MADATRSPVITATDLTEHSEPALVRGRAIADAVGAPFVVVHVVPDVMRHHPLAPARDDNDAVLSLELSKRAAELVTEQVSRVLRISADTYRVIVELGEAEDEIVRIAEEQGALLLAVGARPRREDERILSLGLGHVGERVVRYSHTSVLVARAHRGAHTRKLLVATDFTEGSVPALRFAAALVEAMRVEATLIHVMELPRATPLVSMTSALGSPWMPPPKPALEQLESLGLTMLESLAQQYRFAHFEQVEGNPAEVLVNRAEESHAETVVMGSHGRTGLRRLVLGSVAEQVIRSATRSVLVARAP